MKNKDLLKQENMELMQALSEALKNDDDEAMATAFAQFANGVQERIMQEYRTGIPQFWHPEESVS